MAEEQTQSDNPFLKSGLFITTPDYWAPFKASLEGFAGDGKTHTAALMVAGIFAAEGRKGTVACIDTEGSLLKQVRPMFEEVGIIYGQNLFVTQSRSLVDFNKILEMCEQQRGSILFIDSMTHIHAQMLEDFSRSKGRPVVYPQDAMILKPMWAEKFSQPFIRAKNTHIIFTGRAAWEYRMEINEETRKKEFNPVKVKMRGDNEVAHEPDLLIFMQADQDIGPGGAVEVFHKATILKDRSRILDGKEIKNPNWETFKPVYEYFCKGNVERPSAVQTPVSFRSQDVEAYWQRKREVEVFSEEIEGLFNSYLPGQGPKERKIRADIYFTVFETRSRTALENMAPQTLKSGIDAINFLLHYLGENQDFVARMEADRSNAFDLSRWLKDAYDTWLAENAKPSESTDDIPEFDAPKGPLAIIEGSGNGQVAAKAEKKSKTPEEQKRDEKKKKCLDLIELATAETFPKAKEEIGQLCKRIKDTAIVLEISSALNQKRRELEEAAR